MKKNNQPQKKEGLFSGFGKKKPIIEQPAPKKVRHIENQVKLPFLNDVDEVPGDNKYGRAEDMKDEWGLPPSEATLKHKKTFPCAWYRCGGFYPDPDGSLLYPSEDTAGILCGNEHRTLRTACGQSGIRRRFIQGGNREFRQLDVQA